MSFLMLYDIGEKTKENLLTTVFQLESGEAFYSNDSKRVIEKENNQSHPDGKTNISLKVLKAYN